ncbi:polyketide synthase [Plenodomus lingam]|uniref:Similar to polyketide synthase n=1 Tax=Leptosphaeria maculans (strain JN3 / isolate v23.1.3 / race Av1-4-5-6-7-8) TaxID=985895 RepID=E5A495_LEPMJ|nr:similar to polyketide synthase [Plenodomus lingam JN3]KAH9862327.1 polyketide synthase [Plenodomus lingam]CBX98440.1 similar to polyketide synthase [Plenodomus lingam JN3]
MNLLIFGDQTSDQYALLRKACTLRSNSSLTTFLDRISVVIREEVQKLPRTQRDQIPDFLTTWDLVEAYFAQGVKVPQLESCMVTIAQLAHFIGYYGENPTELPSPANTRVVGLCTGLLAASVVASARSLSELLPLSTEAVRIAFRVGCMTGAARDALERAPNSKQSWSTVTGVSEDVAKDALASFHEQRRIPPAAQAYISAVSTMAITISGPPSTTQRLFDEVEAFKSNSRLPLPVYAPYHAPQIYAQADIERILDKDAIRHLQQFRPLALVHSATTGKCIVSTNTLELVRTALGEILLEQVRWDNLLGEIVNQVTAASSAECTITAIGITAIANSMAAALKHGGQKSVTVRDHNSWTATTDRSRGRTQNDKIAIVGMSGRFPGAASPEQLWDLLAQGLDVHREVPADRFDAQAHCDPSGKGKNKSHTPYGCFIEEPGLFDPRFFNMSPREAAQTDPMGRLALTTAYEALEMSGYVPNRTPSTKLQRIGTFYGQTSDDWREINAAENIDTYFITGGVRAFAPGRINYYFKFSGPSFSIDTACSSSLAAIQLACTSLWAGDCDTACAGGLNVLTNPDIFSGLSKGQFLSKTGGCKTYDNDADGYCRGDGCGSVVLKRYEDAIADKDNILGCILGAATNHSAEAVSITHPHAGAQEFLYNRVLSNAGVDAHDISYVEMHGTGTQAGDGIEMTSVTNAFAPRHRQRRPDQPLHLGAIKANIGHGEAASGINSLVKILMMMKKNAIPANVGIKGVMNKTFPKDLSERNVHIETKMVPWPRKGAEKRKLFLNNFSAAGGNTAVILEDGPLREEPKGVDPRSMHIVTVSARSIASLKKNIDNLVQFLDENSDSTLPSLAYTTTARRIQHNYRVAICVSEMSKVKEALQAQLKDSYSPLPMVPTKTAFTFTGQGSQYTGLGQKLYEQLETFRADIDEMEKLARIHSLPSILPLLAGTDVTTLSPVVVQLGMAAIQVALARMWASWGVKPSAVIGHSLGEYAAIHVAGVISASDMILLVGRRAQLLEQECTANTHGMLAVKGSVEAIKAALGDKMTEVACMNGPEETVLCGTTAVVESTSEALAAKNFKATKLAVPFAFHSAQVDPILEKFKAVAASVIFNKPEVPVMSPLTGQIIREAGIIGPDYLARHARETVDFWSALTTGQEEKLFDAKTAWVEIGAHPVCSGMVKSSLGGAPVTAGSLRRNEDPWKTLSNSIATLYLSGVYFDFNEYHRVFNDAHEMYTLPTYAFDNKRYWLDYHNNWTLTKGELHETAPVVSTVEVPVQEAPSKLSTTSCHRIIREELHANSGTIVVQSDLSDPKLKATITGHQVNGTPLTPSSLYADQAMTVADYLYQQLRPGMPTPGLNVCSMEVTKTLIPQYPPPAGGQHLQIEGTADLELDQVSIKFRTVTADGSKVLVEHAVGVVKYEDVNAWKTEWSRIQYMVQAQIDTLKQKLETGAAHKVLRGMAYKLFKALVSYADNYRGMEEVILDGKQTEATASVQFQTTAADGEFLCSPYWIDSLAHLSGFIVNASDHLDSENSVYISHGWGSIKIAEKLSSEKKYRSYVRMQPAPGNISVGDVYIMDGDRIIGMVMGLKFQNIPRRALNIMMPPSGKASTGPVPKAIAKPIPVKAQPAVTPIKAAPSKSKSLSKSVVVKAAKAPKTVKVVANTGVTSKVMKIVAEEIDVDMSELVEDAAFENLGVDSLLSLTISARFREELEMDIPSSLFTDCTTVGELKKHFAQYDGGVSVVDDAASDTTDEPSDASTPHATTSTPASSAPSEDGNDIDVKISSETVSGEASIARKLVAEEMGVDVSEITDDLDLTDIGMDSLMSLTILGSMREQTGRDLPADFLTVNVTIKDIETALGMRPQPKQQVKVTAKVAPKVPSKSPQLAEVNRKLAKAIDVSHLPPATSVLLQGNPKIATKKFFLVPDGSGSATSYISIPNISPDMAVYGLNCPFMKCPEKWTCGVEGASALYVNEIKRRQPKGPYILGGWSAGGVMAYEVAQQMVNAGEKVESLVLIDSPCPVALDPLPARLHIFFDQIGLLGTGKPGGTPPWLLPHFASAIQNLKDYDPVPMDPKAAPPVLAIWCTDGVCPNPDDPRPPPGEGEDPAPMKWLLNNRTDFSDNGWAQLLPKENFEYAVMGGNHFTMMKGEHGATLGKLIQKGLKL